MQVSARRSGRRAFGAEDRPARALAAGGGLPAIAAGAVTVLAAAAMSGPSGAAGAALGGAVCALAMLSGPALMGVSRTWVPEAAMAAALTLYGLVIFSGWVVFVLVATAGWPSTLWTGIGLGVGVVMWSAGLIRASVRLRLPLWDEPGRHAGSADGRTTPPDRRYRDT